METSIFNFVADEIADEIADENACKGRAIEYLSIRLILRLVFLLADKGSAERSTGGKMSGRAATQQTIVFVADDAPGSMGYGARFTILAQVSSLPESIFPLVAPQVNKTITLDK